MRAAKAVVVEALCVALLGLLLALAANALSPQGLRLSRNYFPSTARVADPASTNAVAVATTTTNSGVTGVASTNPVTPVQPPTVPAVDAVVKRLQEHGLQVATSNDVTRLFRDPRYDQGLVVFVDARDDAHYMAGHIPGAHQFNHYRPEQYLPTVLPACLTAMQIVVYCTGGQCEDSEFAAMMLRDAGIPRDNLFVYPGGINEWTALKLPVELGARRSGQFQPRHAMSNPEPTGKRRCLTPILLVGGRWILGLLFLYLGWKKAMDPVAFLKLVREYHVIDQPWLLNLVAGALPWFEIFCGLLLLLGVAVRGAAVMLVAMLVPFTLMILHRAQELHAVGNIAFCAIHFDCGCGGGEVNICRKLLENTLLIALATWLVFRSHHRLALRPVLFRAHAGNPAAA